MRHLNKSGRWPSGNPRYYYRPKGQKGIPMPDAPTDSPKFRAAYAKAEGVKRTVESEDTLSAAIDLFIASAKFAERAESTRQMWMRTLTDLQRRYGRAPFDLITAKQIRRDLSRFGDNVANNRAKAWKALFAHMHFIGRIDTNPAKEVEKRKVKQTEGFKAWSRDDFAAFRDRWTHDTPQRLAFEVYYRSCAATVDAVRLGPGMVRDGWLTYQRSKTGTVACVPWSDAAPDWFEWTDDLEQCKPAHMVWISTIHGKPRSQKATSQWFAQACREAGLDLSAHGIRKGRAAMFRENGASEDQRMAILGHETRDQATAYSRSADLRRVISEDKSSNLFQLRRNNA